MSDITIPPKSLEAAARAIEQSLLTSQMSAAEPVYAAEARAAALALLEAWPGMYSGPSPADARRTSIILPLPQEPSDGK